MNKQDYESSEFYSYKFRNFSTMIIIPAAILVLLIFIGSFFAVRQNTITSTGIIEPAQVLNLKNNNFHEGQVIKHSKQKWLVHLDDKNQQVAHLMPVIKKKVQVIVYLPANKIGLIKKGQKLSFQLPSSDGLTKRLVGKVKIVGEYPIRMKNASAYEVFCTAKLKNPQQVKYGMEGSATIITGKSTYFEYFKNKILDQRH